MADLSADRSQLLLVGGFVVAISIVAVALLLNTVVMTDAIESREPPRGIDDAREHATVTERAVERIVLRTETVENRTWDQTRTNVTLDLARLGDLLANRSLQDAGAFSNVSTSHTRRGAAIVQRTAGRNFTNNSSTEAWILATTSGIRNYRMTVNGTALPAVNDTAAEDPAVLGMPGFRVNVTDDDGDTWTAFLTNRTSGDGVRIVTRLNNNSPTRHCESDTTITRIDWTAGTVNGEPCGFTFARTLSGPFTLRYEEGDEAAGRYHLVVSNTTGDTVRTESFADDGNPRQYPAMYAVVVTAVYDGPTVSWATDVRVAPGEPAQTSTL